MTQQFKVTVTSKGQVTLPAAYRRWAGIETGTQLWLSAGQDGKATLRPARDLQAFIGSLADVRLDHPLGQTDIDAAVGAAVGARYDRAKARERT